MNPTQSRGITVKFEWPPESGKHYEVPVGATSDAGDVVQLPDGTYVELNNVGEMFPPKVEPIASEGPQFVQVHDLDPGHQGIVWPAVIIEI